ncbi:hypothetical protein ES703_46272 [subsurface metagenome]
MVKEIRRDFTLVVGVPDNVRPEECEIIVNTASASFPGGNAQPSVIAEEPYEVEPEEPPKPKPKCPKCGEGVEMLIGAYSATVSGWVSILKGELNLQLDENLKSWEIVDEDSVTWHCPHCDEQLFKAGEEDKMTVFLRGGGQ